MKALRLWWVVAFYSLRNKLMSLIVSLISLVIHSFNSSSYSGSPWCLALAFLTKHEHAHPVAPLRSWKLLFLLSLCTVSHDIAIYTIWDAVLDISLVAGWVFFGYWCFTFIIFFFRISNRNSKFTLFPLFLFLLQFLLYFLTHSCIHDPFFFNYYCYM